MTGASQAALVYSEDFSTLSLTGSGTTVDPVVTSTTTGGTWYGEPGDGNGANGTSIISNELNFQRPTNAGGWSGAIVVLDGALFTDGADTYRLSFDYVSQTNNTARLFAGVYDVDSGSTGSITSVNSIAGNWDRAFPTGTVTTTGDATAALLGNAIYSETGFKELDFAYDGSGDVLLLFGGGRNSNNFGQSRLDNVAINVIPEPSSTALLGLVLSAGLLIRRKRNN